jgi:cytochrome c-type biogenesis protein
MAGLGTIFISVGASVSLAGIFLTSLRKSLAGLFTRAADAGLLPAGWAASIDPFYLIGGIIIIVMGLHFLGVFRIGLLYRQARFESRAAPGPWGAYVMGLAFAFGWTPCISPVLGTVSAVAGREASVGYGMFLLFIYTLGLGLPFVIAACAMNPFLRFLRSFRAHLGTVEKVTGAMLVATGFAFLSGGMATFAIWLQSTFPVLSKLG